MTVFDGVSNYGNEVQTGAARPNANQTKYFSFTFRLLNETEEV